MKELTGNELKEFTSKGKSVIDFWAPWCGPCQALGPIFEEISKELQEINFAKANIDEVGEEASALGVRGVPTIILFNEGEEINRIVGALPKETLKAQIQEAFK